MLGDNFPIEERCDYIQENVGPGCVLYLFCDFIREPKDKYLVLLHKNNPPLLFFINPEVHSLVKSNKNRKACQVSVSKSNHQFLPKKISYIDCSHVVDNFDMRDIVNQLLSDLSRIKGVVSGSKIKEIIKKVSIARTINNYRKELITSDLIK